MEPTEGVHGGGEAQLLVRLEDIPEKGLELQAVSGPELPLAYVAQEDLGYELLEPVRSEFQLLRRGVKVLVRGRVRTRQALSCDRCLATIEQDVDRRVEVTFMPHPEVPEGAQIELSAQDLEVEFYGPDGLIDLGGVIIEELALAIPYRLLCHEACKGLCPGCGADLNVEECRCPARPLDPRLAKLQDLKIEH